MSWFRLDTDYFIKDKVTKLDYGVRYSVIGIIAYVKNHGRQGVVRASASEIAREKQLRINDVSKALKNSGFFEVKGKEIRVIDWEEYQLDPGMKKRVANWRNRKKKREKKIESEYGKMGKGLPDL